MKIPYFCCIGAELKRYEKDFDFMNQVYLYKIPADDTLEEVLAQDYFQAIADTVLQDDLLYIYEPTAQALHMCRFNKQGGHITAVQLSNNVPGLTPNRVLISDATGHITAGDVTLEYLKNKVNLDGTSIMTGPLKMRSSVSFKCAIAPSWDGVGFYKLNDNDSVTLMASMETTDGLCPATNNTYNIGKASHKWKDAYIARVITAVINNGGDLAVPANTTGTLATKADVDLAANSGSQLYSTGVWYAKMYSASTVPTGSEYDGKNYADFSQVDQDNNPIIVIYEGQSGAWVEIERITPPTAYNGYITVTSKIWDIVEQTDQQGGQVLWSYNQKTFTPYPRIVSVAGLANTDLSNLTATGKANISALGTYDSNETYAAGTVGAAITDKADTNLSNLTTTGKANVSAQGTYDSGETYTAGTVGAAISGKVDKGHEVIAYQAPTSGNNYTWYRKYKDGWVEQGGVKSAASVADGTGTAGNIEITLPVTMKNSQYWYSANTEVGGSGWEYANGVILNARTTTKLTLKVLAGTSSSLQVFWEVKGVAA